MTLRPRPLLPLVFRRSFGTRNRDVMAKYRRRPESEAFETASTIPAGPSIQEVPPPDTSGEGVRKAIQLPAMQPLVLPQSGPGKGKEEEIVVEGVVIPPKPRPPTEEECCMSGCVHCVYNIYADDLEVYTEALRSARQALTTSGRAESTWPEAVRRAESIKEEGKAEVKEGMDPVMSAFLAMENKLKKKQVDAKGSTAGAG